MRHWLDFNQKRSKKMAGYYVDIEKRTRENAYFREVLFTGALSQLVVMSLQPGEETGLKTHPATDQFIRVEEGEGKAILQGAEYKLRDGSAIIIPAGTDHNIINTCSKKALKLYTIYTPPEHPRGMICKTKADAGTYEDEHHA
jgi:mannose-6-phosphate isomerase-like protein (cupin superfamily)